MRRAAVLHHPHALSPYAQALRQVALQGAVALGPSAREMDLTMHRLGTLQADYRPPVHGKWDDTVERWAYAWQFPAADDGEHDDVVCAVTRNRSGFARLLTFCEKLAQTPPSTVPGSAARSTRYGTTHDEGSGAQETDLALPPSGVSLPLLPSSSPTPAVDFNELEASLHTMRLCAPHAITTTTTQPSTDDRASEGHASDGDDGAVCMQSAEQYAHAVGLPVAYLDDKSERSSASRELYVCLRCVGLDYTEDGLVVAVAALSRQSHMTAARALFTFACHVGLGPNAELYKSLMLAPATRGDVNGTMTLIEEMKERGITPRIGNWHVLMRAFHSARDYAAVSQIVDHMKMYANIEPNERTFVLQLRALAKDATQQNALAEAIQLFDQMENVYGYIAARPHYDALMYALSRNPAPEMRLRCEELAQKMRLMGIAWNATTYLNLIRAAQLVGDVVAVERLLARMRDERVPMTMLHLTWAVHAHVQHMLRLDYNAMKDKDGSDALDDADARAEHAIVTKWYDHMNVCFGIYELAVRRGWTVQLPMLNALLRLCCQLTILAMEHLPQRIDVAGRFEEQATQLWKSGFDEWALTPDVYSYECYIALLAHQQRIDEAELLFQQLVLQKDATPTRRTYECLLFMHLSSGDEGGAARALRYLEAMEQAQLPIRASLLRKMVRVHDAAGYKRDMKRRARRIMQAREEYMAHKAEQEAGNFADVVDAAAAATDTASPPSATGDAVDRSMSCRVEGDAASVTCAQDGAVPMPLPLRPDSTLAWWQRWKETTLSKHELFASENEDGTRRGERFDEKNDALAKLGITSPYAHPRDVPTASSSSAASPSGRDGKEATRGGTQQRLLPALRAAEGEVTGALWALDGGELSYPRDGGGPSGWGVRLWRERALLRKHANKSRDGAVAPSPFSELGIAARPAGEQLDIEASGARTPGELADWQRFPQHRYDDTNAAKPPSELATQVPPSAELVWRGESRDALAPYKTDAELALENDSTFYAQHEHDAAVATRAAAHALQLRNENAVDIVGRGVTRRSKYDYLEKWRDMYRHGTLDVPAAPLLRFGRGADDHHETMAASVRAWFARNQHRKPASDARDKHNANATTRAAEVREARAALRSGQQRRRRRPTTSPQPPSV